MDKGIRFGVNQKFNDMLSLLPTIGGKKFRKQILEWTVETYDVTMSSATTHYNHAFHVAKKDFPELVVGLGRPEGKNNGGRKKMVLIPIEKTSVQIQEVNQLDPDKSIPTTTPLFDTVQTVFTVFKKADDSIVAEGLSKDDAELLVKKSVQRKKEPLYFA